MLVNSAQLSLWHYIMSNNILKLYLAEEVSNEKRKLNEKCRSSFSGVFENKKPKASGRDGWVRLTPVHVSNRYRYSKCPLPNA